MMEPPGIQKWQALLYREQCALYIDVEQLVKMLLDDFTEGVMGHDIGRLHSLDILRRVSHIPL
jgi:hypothetical protein